MMMHCLMVNTMQSLCMCNSFKQNFVYTRSTKHVHYWAHTGRLIPPDRLVFECGMGDVMDVFGKYQVELAMVVTQFTQSACSTASWKCSKTQAKRHAVQTILPSPTYHFLTLSMNPTWWSWAASSKAWFWAVVLFEVPHSSVYLYVAEGKWRG